MSLKSVRNYFSLPLELPFKFSGKCCEKFGGKRLTSRALSSSHVVIGRCKTSPNPEDAALFPQVISCIWYSSVTALDTLKQRSELSRCALQRLRVGASPGRFPLEFLRTLTPPNGCLSLGRCVHRSWSSPGDAVRGAAERFAGM